MTRRLLPIALLALAAAAPLAQAEPFEAGRHYQVLEPVQPTGAKPGQVEVLEFFSIGCPHCAEFEPYMQSWLKRKPANVVVTRVPATFNPFFKLMGKAYYALQDVGAAEKATPLLFDAIHESRDPEIIRPLGEYNNKVNSGDMAGAAAAEQQVLTALCDFLAVRVGVDQKKFRAAWNSFSMNTRLAQADATFRAYGVRGVPALAVDGKYLTTTGRTMEVQSYQQLMQIGEQLVAMELALLPKPKAPAKAPPKPTK